jgi:hypothetical protein
MDLPTFSESQSTAHVVRRRWRREAIRWPIAAGALLLGLSWAPPAAAIPAFARKYATSCTTCHVVYPKLTPFGEAFRRNGYRFPGVDSEMIKQDPVSLGQQAYKGLFPNAVWPGTIPGSPPLSLGFNGQITLHPDSKAGGAVADNGARVVFDNLVEEAHLWAGGSLDDKLTFWAELTVDAEGIGIEKAQLLFNDLAGPVHASNLVVGKGVSTLSSFAQHSSYLADAALLPLSVTALYGATSNSWMILDNYNMVELNGTIRGRFDYSLGINQGANSAVRSPRNVYAHVGFKMGGVRLDGEEGSSVPDPMKPWAETAVTLDAFAYHSDSRYTSPDPASTTAMPLADLTLGDKTNAFGAGLRAQWLSLELNSGILFEQHDQAAGVGSKVSGLAQFDELSYVVFPWLVPAVRFEYVRLSPDGGDVVTDTRLLAGVAALVRPNVKLTLVAQFEQAKGLPPGGWGPVGGFAAPASATDSVSLEAESVNLGLAYAY